MCRRKAGWGGGEAVWRGRMRIATIGPDTIERTVVRDTYVTIWSSLSISMARLTSRASRRPVDIGVLQSAFP